jgi:hypothetical protein
MFADAGAQDFHCTDKTPYPLLNGGCDMIDLARAKPDSVALRQILVRDVDSKTRPIDLWDIGACEYQIHRAGSIGGQRGRRPDGGRTQTGRTTRAIGLAPLSPPPLSPKVQSYHMCLPWTKDSPVYPATGTLPQSPRLLTSCSGRSRNSRPPYLTPCPRRHHGRYLLSVKTGEGSVDSSLHCFPPTICLKQRTPTPRFSTRLPWR